MLLHLAGQLGFQILYGQIHLLVVHDGSVDFVEPVVVVDELGVLLLDLLDLVDDGLLYARLLFQLYVQATHINQRVVLSVGVVGQICLIEPVAVQILPHLVLLL